MLTLMGLFGFRAMKIQNFPDIDLPTVTVTASLPGASPAQLETEVARKIENAVATLQGVKHIYTKVQDGTATITVEFRLEKPTQEAVDDVRDAVARVRSDLPGDLRDPQIAKMELSGLPILTYTRGIKHDGRGSAELVRRQQRDQGDAQRARRGRGGARGRRHARGAGRAGPGAAAGAERDRGRHLAPAAPDPAGSVGRAHRCRRRRAVGAHHRHRAVGRRAGAHGNRAVRRPPHPPRPGRAGAATRWPNSARPRCSNGKPVVGFEITRSRGAGEVDVAAGVRAALAKLKAEHPDIAVTEAFNFVDPVQENYDGSMLLLYEGALLAVLVVWLFLRDWRATLVAATALPLSVIPAFGVMYLFGFTINVVTLLSLSLVVGILVDDAIVEIENIMRHLRMGKTPFEAAMEAADEIGLAVIATTFTLIAVFLPTAFMAGVPGKFFVQFGWTAAIAVFFSLVVARMLTPMMAAYLLQAGRATRMSSRAG